MLQHALTCSPVWSTGTVSPLPPTDAPDRSSRPPGSAVRAPDGGAPCCSPAAKPGSCGAPPPATRTSAVPGTRLGTGRRPTRRRAVPGSICGLGRGDGRTGVDAAVTKHPCEFRVVRVDGVAGALDDVAHLLIGQARVTRPDKGSDPSHMGCGHRGS
jgi:hypothetical protein